MEVFHFYIILLKFIKNMMIHRWFGYILDNPLKLAFVLYRPPKRHYGELIVWAQPQIKYI